MVKNATTCMTNSKDVAIKLDKTCHNSAVIESLPHRHVQLINGRAAQAQVYPKALCRAVCEGVALQKEKDKSNIREVSLLFMDEMHVIMKASIVGNEEGSTLDSADQPDDALHEPEAEIVAQDDVSGEPLDPQMVHDARREEIGYFKSMGVYKKVPVATCWDATGRKPTAVRWIDVNKGDSKSPQYRSRLVAK